jgi:HK97 family phage major capsid protein
LELKIEEENEFLLEWQKFTNSYKKQVDKINNLEEVIVKLKMENIKMDNFINVEPTLNYEKKDDGLTRFVKGNLCPEEIKSSFSTDNEDRGEFAVISERYKHIITRMAELSPIRLLASVDTISSNSLELLIQDGKFDSGWVEERGVREGFDTPKLLSKKIMVHEIYAQPKATQKLLDDSFVNIEEWISSQLVQAFARAENDAFINGDGINKPKGILSYGDEVEKIESEEDDGVTFIDLVNLINALDEDYQKNASFLMNKRTLATIQKLQDRDGRFIWQPSMSDKSPSTLLGIPVICCSDMPAIEAGKSVVAIADFKQAYKIVDRHGISIMKDPYTEKPFTKFYATKRVGGDVIDSSAIKLLAI